MDYIFVGLQSSEVALKHIQRTLRCQQKFNRHVVLCTCITTAYLILMEVDRREQCRKIDRLTKEIEELRPPEGE